jgi:hypothetical protein
VVEILVCVVDRDTHIYVNVQIFRENGVELTMVELKQVPSILIVGDMVVVDLFNLKILR